MHMILLQQILKKEVKKSNNIEYRYMTISSRGITHYINGVGEFITIENWEIEAKFFLKLLNL